MTYEYRVVETELGEYHVQTRYAGGDWSHYSTHFNETEAVTNYLRTIRSKTVKRVILTQETK